MQFDGRLQWRSRSADSLLLNRIAVARRQGVEQRERPAGLADFKRLRSGGGGRRISFVLAHQNFDEEFVTLSHLGKVGCLQIGIAHGAPLRLDAVERNPDIVFGGFVAPGLEFRPRNPVASFDLHFRVCGGLAPRQRLLEEGARLLAPASASPQSSSDCASSPV
jgi:hypothetical protein